jgi:hypothetical protein
MGTPKVCNVFQHQSVVELICFKFLALINAFLLLSFVLLSGIGSSNRREVLHHYRSMRLSASPVNVLFDNNQVKLYPFCISLFFRVSALQLLFFLGSGSSAPHLMTIRTKNNLRIISFDLLDIVSYFIMVKRSRLFSPLSHVCFLRIFLIVIFYNEFCES